MSIRAVQDADFEAITEIAVAFYQKVLA